MVRKWICDFNYLSKIQFLLKLYKIDLVPYGEQIYYILKVGSEPWVWHYFGEMRLLSIIYTNAPDTPCRATR